jgi:acyl-CoA synthetase (NDP forming)
VTRDQPTDAELRTIGNYSALEDLATCGLHIVPASRAGSASEAAAAANVMGFPCVLKTDRPDVAHKAEVGGVLANLRNPTEVASAYEKLVVSVGGPTAEAPGEAVVVEPMVRGVAEVMVGTFTDPSVGHIMGIGIGGTLVELLGGLSYVLLPATRAEVAEAIRRMPAAKLLNGYRGAPEADLDALIDAAEAIGRYVVKHNDVIVELDVNPIIVGHRGAGAVAVDALVIRRREPATPAVIPHGQARPVAAASRGQG